MSPPVPVVFALAQIVFAREPRVHAATRPSLRPHLCRGQAVKQSSGARRRESARACRYLLRMALSVLIRVCCNPRMLRCENAASRDCFRCQTDE